MLRKPSLARRNPDRSESASAVMEHAPIHDTVAAAQTQMRDTTKYVVRITSYRTRLLDEDNLAEKYHVDACRYAGLLPSDAPDKTTIQVRQIKVRKEEECRTEIFIEPVI